ncbi:hypothetical protein BH10ACI3_BH10ACI3_09480 [soil metagenome]
MQEITKTDDSTPTAVPRYVWVVLAVLAVFVYFFGLTIPFLGPDEARYAQVAREMMDRGDWVTPTLGGFHWFEKPALLYWLEIVSYKIFGVNEFAARFGPALFGLGTVVSLWILGRSVEFDKKATSNGFANYLALIAATTFGLIVFSRGASFDIIVTFPMTAAMVSFFIFDRSTETSFREKHLPLILFYVFIGVSLLAKGLIGILFPIAIVAFYYVLSLRLPSRAFLFSLTWGTLLSCVIAAIWYLPVYQQNGYEFVNEFFIQHHFQRFTSNKYQHPQPFYFFLWVLPLMTMPWLPFFFGAVWKTARVYIYRKNAESQDGSKPLLARSPLLLFTVAWMLVPLVFFSVSGSKLPGYILPAVPAAIVLTALFLYDLIRRKAQWRSRVMAIAVLTFCTVIGLLIFEVPKFAATDSVRSLLQAANDRGFTSNRVLIMHTISHNAEFYATGRLLRETDGKQRRLYGSGEVLAEIEAENRTPVLVIVPIEYKTQLTKDTRLKTEFLKDNGELAIAAVSLP